MNGNAPTIECLGSGAQGGGDKGEGVLPTNFGRT